MRTRRYGWPAAAVILVADLFIELLPILSRSGYDAGGDWSLLYITGRFVVLPVACACHIGTNLVAVAVDRSRAAFAALPSIIAPVAYLVLLWKCPTGLVGWLRP